MPTLPFLFHITEITKKLKYKKKNEISGSNTSLILALGRIMQNVKNVQNYLTISTIFRSLLCVR